MLVVSLIVLIWASAVWARPAQVFLIRHGEKPADEKENHLSPKGRQRAAALVPYFLETPELLKFGSPVAIYAQPCTEPKKHSARPIETVEALAKALKFEVRTPAVGDGAPKDAFPAMVKEILEDPKYDGKSVLICWSHGPLPLIAHKFGAEGVPEKWNDDHFDRVWVLTFHKDGKVKCQDVPQRLLFGDAAK